MKIIAWPPVTPALEEALLFLEKRGLEAVTAEENDIDDPATLATCCDVLVLAAEEGFEKIASIRQSQEAASLPIAAWGRGDSGRSALEQGADLLLDPEESPSLLALRLAALVRRAQLGGAPRVDSLTGLVNHTRFESLLAHEFDRATRYRRALGLLVLEPDRFEELNQDMGLRAGDSALQDLSEVLRRLVRDVDLPARLSGKRFAAILPETDAGGALTAGERLRAAVENHLFRGPCRSGGKASAPFRITVSVGVAAYPSRGMESAGDLLGRSTESLIHAQRREGNRVVAFGAADIIWSREAPKPTSF